MQMPAIDINTLIIAALVAGALYGLIAGKFHLRLLVLSIYVGLVLAERLATLVQPYLTMLSPEQVSWLLLGVPMLIFSFVPRGHSVHGDKGSAIINLLAGILAGALGAASAIHVLPTSQLEAINQSSFLAAELNMAYLWLLGGLPLVVLVLTFHKPKEHGKGGHH